MTEKINTTISVPHHMWDKTGQLVPEGNYYYRINTFDEDSDIFSGQLYCKGSYGEFEFKSNNLVKMMAIAQSRLARRAEIKDKYMPTYSSPNTSPKRKDIKNFLFSNTEIVKKWKPGSEPKEQCTICLENILSECKLLKCKHKFHKTCIKEWFKTSDTCPVCRDPQEQELGRDPREQELGRDPREQELGVRDLYSEYGLQSSLSRLPSLSEHILRGYRRRNAERRSSYVVSNVYPNYAHK